MTAASELGSSAEPRDRGRIRSSSADGFQPPVELVGDVSSKAADRRMLSAVGALIDLGAMLRRRGEREPGRPAGG